MAKNDAAIDLLTMVTESLTETAEINTRLVKALVNKVQNLEERIVRLEAANRLKLPPRSRGPGRLVVRPRRVNPFSHPSEKY